MKIALLQYPIVWAEPRANVGLLDERLRAIAGKADIAVVPEMFSTGFCTDRPDLAEPWGGPTCQALQHMADEYNMAIASEQEMKAKAQEARAKVIEAEALVPQAMAEAFRNGNLGIMDYYRMQNMQADTTMRENIATVSEAKKGKK